MLASKILICFLLFFTFISSPYFILLLLMEYVSVILTYTYITSGMGYLSPVLIIIIFAFIFERVLYSCILITHNN